MRTELGENNITNSTLATQHQQQQHQQQQQQHKMSPAAIFMGNQPNWVLKLVLGLNQKNENNNPERKHGGRSWGVIRLMDTWYSMSLPKLRSVYFEWHNIIGNLFKIYIKFLSKKALVMTENRSIL